MIMRDLFLTSMDLREQNLTITVADLINVYNNLIEKREVILVDGFDKGD
jgi:hypothetical protein